MLQKTAAAAIAKFETDTDEINLRSNRRRLLLSLKLKIEIEIDYNTVSKRAVLWARPCGGLEPLDLCRPDPPNRLLPLFLPPLLARLLLYLPQWGRCRGS